MKLLVVDDIAFSRNIVIRQLKDAGYRPLGAGSAREAIELLHAHQDIAAVITDQEMPEITGVGLFKECRDRMGDATPPFILHTGTNDTAAMLEAKQLGFADVLVKPFDVERAIQTLKALPPRADAPRAEAGPAPKPTSAGSNTKPAAGGDADT